MRKKHVCVYAFAQNGGGHGFSVVFICNAYIRMHASFTEPFLSPQLHLEQARQCFETTSSFSMSLNAACFGPNKSYEHSVSFVDISFS